MLSSQHFGLCCLREGDGAGSPIALNLDTQEVHWLPKLPDLKERPHQLHQRISLLPCFCRNQTIVDVKQCQHGPILAVQNPQRGISI
jgi:hypothetical protein